MNPRLLDEAIDDASEAAHYYAGIRDGLADEFVAELRRVIDAIAEHPERFPPHQLATKRIPFRASSLERFPYHVIYRVEGGEVIVYAIAHHKRRPGYWLRRRD